MTSSVPGLRKVLAFFREFRSCRVSLNLSCASRRSVSAQASAAGSCIGPLAHLACSILHWILTEMSSRQEPKWLRLLLGCTWDGVNYSQGGDSERSVGYQNGSAHWKTKSEARERRGPRDEGTGIWDDMTHPQLLSAMIWQRSRKDEIG